jgi:hypothetical protein
MVVVSTKGEYSMEALAIISAAIAVVLTLIVKIGLYLDDTK